jgi:hypothetical protein
MRRLWIPASLGIVLLSACESASSIKPVEYLDDRTAMTVGSLKEPIELVPSLHQGGLHMLSNLGNLGKKVSFAYLGPVEWDRSGSIVYGLWVHIGLPTCIRAASLTIDGFDPRQDNGCAGPDIAKIHIGVVFGHQPHRQIRALLSNDPQRLTALDHIVLGA